MDIMIHLAGDTPAAMVFIPVSAGAFVDALPVSEQSMCMERTMTTVVLAARFSKRRS